MKKVTIHTDASGSPNNKHWWWGAKLQYGKEERYFLGKTPKGTRQQDAEFQAIVEAISLLKQPCDITVYTDFQGLLSREHEIRTMYTHHKINLNWIRRTSGGIKPIDALSKFARFIKASKTITIEV